MLPVGLVSYNDDDVEAEWFPIEEFIFPSSQKHYAKEHTLLDQWDAFKRGEEEDRRKVDDSEMHWKDAFKRAEWREDTIHNLRVALRDLRHPITPKRNARNGIQKRNPPLAIKKNCAKKPTLKRQPAKRLDFDNE
jgi:hypothetical protein